MYDNILQPNIIDSKNNNLPGFSQTSLTRHTSKQQHQNSCRICKHDKRAEIDEKIVHLDIGASFFPTYGIDLRCVLSHIKACDLMPDIQEIQRIQQLKCIIKANAEDAKLSDNLSLLDQINKQAGVYQSPAQAPDITLIQQLMSAKAVEPAVPTVENTGVQVISEDVIKHPMENI